MSLFEELSQVLVLAPKAVDDLNDDATPLQLKLFTFFKIVLLAPMSVADEIATIVVHHDALVESMKRETTILPSLLFALEVVCEEAGKIENRCDSRY